MRINSLDYQKNISDRMPKKEHADNILGLSHSQHNIICIKDVTRILYRRSRIEELDEDQCG